MQISSPINLLLAQVICMGFVVAAPVSFESRAVTFLGATDTERPFTYKIMNRRFADADVDKVLKVFEKRGFVTPAAARKVSERVFASSIGTQWLQFDSSSSAITYNDQEVGDLTATDVASPAQLKSISDGMLNDLLGAKASEFFLTHVENTYMVGPNLPQILTAITFRYMHKVDERFVHGTLNHARITIGNLGRIKALEITDPVITKVSTIRGRAKRAWLAKKLEADLQKLDVEARVKVSQHSIRNVVKTLSLSNGSGGTLLTPSLGFTVINQNKDGKEETLEISMNEDADQVENLDPEDVEVLVPSKK